MNKLSNQPHARQGSARLRSLIASMFVAGMASVLVGCSNNDGNNDEDKKGLTPFPSQSSNVAIISQEQLTAAAGIVDIIAVPNPLIRPNGTVSFVKVTRGDDELGTKETSQKLAEISVGTEPHSVVATPDGKRVFVSNRGSKSVSVIDVDTLKVIKTITVGAAPSGIATSPNGKFVVVANFTQKTASIIDVASLEVVNTVTFDHFPYAVAISNDGDANDNDETVFVTQFFAEIIPDGPGEMFDNGKQGVVYSFPISGAAAGTLAVSETIIPPIANSGFTANLSPLCRETRQTISDTTETVFFNSGKPGTGGFNKQLGVNALREGIFQKLCPDQDITDPTDPVVAKVPQSAYPNQLFSIALISGDVDAQPGATAAGDKFLVTAIGAQPQPPVNFNTNVQALLNVGDSTANTITTTNLNNDVKGESNPTVPNTLQKAFIADPIAVAVVPQDGEQTDRLLVLSRGGNYVVEATLKSDNTVSLGAPNVVRYQTGNKPTGLGVTSDGERAYTYNEVNRSITSIDLANQTVVARDIDASTPPAPGTQGHRNSVGNLVFFTSLGVPDDLDTNGDDQFDIALRDIDPVQNRGKASDNSWSSCGSCHPDGLSDGVTWSFATGPRQTIPLDGTFFGNNQAKARIQNWNGVRDSVTDFNENSVAVQGGEGWAGANTGLIFNHGPNQGISDALDAMTDWVRFAVHTPDMPEEPVVATGVVEGRAVFEQHCTDCHAGEGWTNSEQLYTNNPSFAQNPIGAGFFDGVPPVDERVVALAGGQVKSITIDGKTTTFINNVGTFDANGLIQVRGGGAVAGQLVVGSGAVGAGGFNNPSLLGVGANGPYLHDGSAKTLQDVFEKHTLPAQANQTIAVAIGDAEKLSDLEAFLNTIDEETTPFPQP